MPTSWRLVKEIWKTEAFTGEGARRFAGRWHSRGVPVVYTAESRSLAVLEALVNFADMERRSLPGCVLFEVSFGNALVEIAEPAMLPPSWDSYPVSPATREFGDRWAQQLRSAVLQVPSLVTRGEFNYILNPFHPEFDGIEIGPPEARLWDPRL